MRVLGYCRVSTIDQAANGESLEAQQRKLVSYCELHDLPTPQVFIDSGISASIHMHKRPQGALLLESIRPGDMLLAPKLDRLFRSALDALGVRESFMKRGIELCFCDIGEVTKGPIGSLFFMMSAAFAETERMATSERTCTVKHDQKTRGRYLGGAVPFGYRASVDGQLEPYAPEQMALDEARLMKQGGLSNRKISQKLASLGHKVSHVTLGKLI